MKKLGQALIIILGGVVLFGCATAVPLAPGADQVRITKNPADVASCAPVGNIDSRIEGLPSQVQAQMQNQAVGLGGNVVLETSAQGTGLSGVIYRCGH